MIRTAIPFGYLFVLLILLTIFIIGAGLLIWGWRRRFRFAKWIGVVLCSFIAIIGVVEIAFEDSLEWNPIFVNDSQVVGVWTNHSQTVELSSDHTFLYKNALETSHGTWTRDDWNLYLHSEPSFRPMRFVQFGKQYRLMTDPPDDPDMWNGNLGLWLIK